MHEFSVHCLYHPCISNIHPSLMSQGLQYQPKLATTKVHCLSIGPCSMCVSVLGWFNVSSIGMPLVLHTNTKQVQYSLHHTAQFDIVPANLGHHGNIIKKQRMLYSGCLKRLQHSASNQCLRNNFGNDAAESHLQIQIFCLFIFNGLHFSSCQGKNLNSCNYQTHAVQWKCTTSSEHVNFWC